MMSWNMTRTLAALTAASCLTLFGCDVDVEDEGELPEIDVEAREGELPEVDVQGPDVDVRGEETEVYVPKVGVEKETITVPDVDVDVPEEEDNELPADRPE